MQSIKQSYFLVLLLLASVSTSAQNSLDMSLVGRWDVDTLPIQGDLRYNDIWGWVDCNGREYAIVGSAAYIHFLELPGDGQPVEVSRHPGSSLSIWRDFKTYRDRAYAVADQGTDGLLIFDMAGLPDTTTLENQLTDHFTRAHNIFIDEANGLLFAVGINTSSDLVIYDLNDDPGAPKLLFDGALPGGYIHDIHVRDSLAFASSGNNGLWVYNLSDPANPTVAGTLTQYPESGYNHSSWLTPDGQHLVFADESFGRSLKLADVSQLDDIEVISLFKSALLAPEATASIAHNPFVRDHYVVASYYHDGVQIFDLANPDTVVRTAYFDTYPENEDYAGFDGNWGVYPFLPSERIIATDIAHGLFVLVADSIDFTDVQPSLAPDLSLTPTADTLICTGATVTLSASETADSLQWWRNGDPIAGPAQQITVDEAGLYWVTGRNGYCTGRSDTLLIEVAPLPDPGFTVSADRFCSGDTVQITTNGTADLYRWRLDGELISQDSTGVLSVTTGGIYQFEAQDGPCTAESEPVLIEEQFLPEVSLNPAEIAGLCPGDTLLLTVESDADSLFLFFGQMNQGPLLSPATITLPGIYSILAQTGDCLNESEALEVFLFETIPPVITRDGNLLTSSPAVDYQWYRDGVPIEDAAGQTFQVMESGQYSVLTVDSNGCSAFSEPVEVIVSAATEARGSQVRHYPQPVADRLWLEAEEVIQMINLRDIRGQLVRRVVVGSRQAEIPVADLPAGLYLVEVVGDRGSQVVRMLKH